MHRNWHLQNLKDLSVEQLAHVCPPWEGEKLKKDFITILAQWQLSNMQHLC